MTAGGEGGGNDTVGIIGAGPAGLAAAAELKRAGIPFEVLERHSDVGGIWDLENPGTPMYESAHFISSRTLSAFDGFPFDEDLPDYPRREQVLDYLRAFAERSGAAEHITFGAEVVSAERGDGEWQVTLGDGSRRHYGHLVAATGHQWAPRLPVYPGHFDGETMHSRDYRSPEVFRGRRVLIVGAGNSGCDIACDAAPVAARAALSVRRGYHFFPKHLFGQPSDVFAHGGPSLPIRAEQAMLTLALKMLVGDVTRYGLPAPDHRVLESHPIMNTQVLHYLGHGDLVARGDIAELRGEEVAFAGDEVESFDLIVWATGFEVEMPYLDRDLFAWHGTRPQLFLTQFHPEADDLSVMGLFEVDAGAYPILSLQGRMLAQVLSDQRTRPRQAEAFRALKQTRPDLSGGTRHVDSERHDISIQDAAYQRYVKALLDKMAAGSAGSADELPLIDEHSRSVAAPPERTWAAIVAYMFGSSTPAAERYARLVGCDPAEASGTPGSVGSALPGFAVARSEPGRELVFTGRHRFSRYELAFTLEREGADRTLVRATTRAAFPGLAGRAYRTAVIGSRGHVLMTSRMLRGIARRAEGGG